MLPATHGGTATHASVAALHAKAGVLQAQLVWPVSELAAYAAEVGQVAHTGDPGSVEYEPALQFVHAPPKVENWPGAHGRQAPDEREEPAGHAVAEAEGDGVGGTLQKRHSRRSA